MGTEETAEQAARDAVVEHDFAFTPALSLHVSDEDGVKIARFDGLAEGGQVLMPFDADPFNRRFGLVQDRFGVSWKLSAT